MSTLLPLIIRADASVTMGTGHVMRSLALAQAYKDEGGQVALVSDALPKGLTQRFQVNSIPVFPLRAQPGSPDDAIETIRLARRWGASWIGIDGYHFSPLYQSTIKENDFRLLVIDDLAHGEHYYADIVLNQNAQAEQLRYSHEPKTRLLLGTKYVLLRREFLAWRTWQRVIPDTPQTVLVTLGGSDPNNTSMLMLNVLDALNVEFKQVTIVTGVGNRHYEQLKQAARASRQSVHIESNVTDMPSLLASADVALSAAGTTALEIAFMGLPALLCATAINQSKALHSLQTVGAAGNIGHDPGLNISFVAKQLEQLVANRTARERMSYVARRLVDGLGSERLIEQMRTL